RLCRNVIPAKAGIFSQTHVCVSSSSRKPAARRVSFCVRLEVRRHSREWHHPFPDDIPRPQTSSRRKPGSSLCAMHRRTGSRLSPGRRQRAFSRRSAQRGGSQARAPFTLAASERGMHAPMMSGWLLLLVALAYVGLLFTVAWLGERHPGLAQG